MSASFLAGLSGYSKDMLQQVDPDGSPLLLLHPTLLLTEKQCDYLSWDEIKQCVDMHLYIDGKMFPFALEPTRLSPNQMLVSMLLPGSHEGLYLPLDWQRPAINLRSEWTLDFSRYGLCHELGFTQISHTQQLILKMPDDTGAAVPLVLNTFASTSNELTAVSADPYHLKRRAELTRASIDQIDGQTLITETLTATLLNGLAVSA